MFQCMLRPLTFQEMIFITKGINIWDNDQLGILYCALGWGRLDSFQLLNMGEAFRFVVIRVKNNTTFITIFINWTIYHFEIRKGLDDLYLWDILTIPFFLVDLGGGAK